MRLLVVMFAGCAQPVPDFAAPWGTVDDDLAATYAGRLEEARAEQELPGLAMAIADRDDHTLWVGATGSAVLDPPTPWEPTHASRIGSVTKTFTAALIFQLVEEGTLTLDDPIERWVPGWYEGPTLRDLLGHTSGIASYNYIGSFDASRPWTPPELVRWAWDIEPDLRFAPGTAWEYSNTNYVLLGMAAEAATGRSYGDELEARFFTPLGLTETRLATTGDADSNLVHSYAGTPPVDNSDANDPSMAWAAGAVVSTPTDLARWAIALYSGEVLEPESLTRMTTPSPVTTPDQGQCGLGAFYESDGEYTLYGHTGGIAGYLSFAYYLEDPAVALVILSNRDPTDLRAASQYGWAAILDIPYP